MESNAWLVLVTAGLCLDICGVIILAGPLLNFSFKDYNRIKNYFKKLEEDMKKSLELNKDADLTKPQPQTAMMVWTAYELLRVERNQVGYERNASFDKLTALKEARIALIIIITGFLLQIIGNAIKA